MYTEMIDFQKIVDRVIGILGKNINIMDEEGIIIASGDKDRVNTFHEAAKIASKEKREVIVDEKNINCYKGCKMGVNLPIYYHGYVLGVVGITGEKKDVKDFGLIVKELVELMIQEDEKKQNEVFERRAVKNFAKELIKENNDEDCFILKQRAQLVDFDLSQKRVVIVCDISKFGNMVMGGRIKSEIEVQRIKQNIVDIFNQVSLNKHDIALNLKEDRFVVLKKADRDIIDYCKQVENLIYEKHKLKLHMGIGSECINIEDYFNSYVFAHQVVNIGRKINPTAFIYHWKDYRLQILLKDMQEHDKLKYINSFDDIFSKPIDKEMKDILLTIKTYFENSMKIGITAQAMYIHRNTVLYRLKKFRELFNIDINNFYQCMQIYIAITLKQLN